MGYVNTTKSLVAVVAIVVAMVLFVFVVVVVALVIVTVIFASPISTAMLQPLTVARRQASR